jgi:hypothetical protein
MANLEPLSVPRRTRRPNMPTLRATLNALATDLASDIVDVIRSSSLEELRGGGVSTPHLPFVGCLTASAGRSGRARAHAIE